MSNKPKRKVNLDQFYTKSEVAEKLTSLFLVKIKELGYQKVNFLEPSAGDGNFIQAIRKFSANSKLLALDIEPREESVVKADFLTLDLSEHEMERGSWLVLGNPPFGKKGKLAIEFINKCAKWVDTIGFILPLTFRRYSVQSKLNQDLKLVLDLDLEPSSFYTLCKINFRFLDYGLATCFQVWTKRTVDLRIREKPLIKCPDFEMFLHNNTKETLKYFDKDKYGWDFAVVRQGFYNYKEIIWEQIKLVKNRQYMFFKAKTKEIRDKLLKIDFEKLARKQMVVWGFGKSDIIKDYQK